MKLGLKMCSEIRRLQLPNETNRPYYCYMFFESIEIWISFHVEWEMTSKAILKPNPNFYKKNIEGFTNRNLAYSFCLEAVDTKVQSTF